MPRIIVMADRPSEDPELIHSETVSSALLEDDRAGLKIIERMAWAVVDAEVAEGEPVLVSS